PLLGDYSPYVTAWAAVAFAAYYCGLGPSIATALTAACGVWLWFQISGRSQLIPDRTELAGIIFFLLFSCVVIAFAEAPRRSRIRQQNCERALRENQFLLKLGMQNMGEEIRKRIAEVQQKTAQTIEQGKLLDLADDAIFVRAADDKISYWNQGAERLY